MTVELKKGYYIDSYYDKDSKSYITSIKDKESNQVGEILYSDNMTDRNSDIQNLKEIFNDKNRWEEFESSNDDNVSSDLNNRKFLASNFEEGESFEESLDSKIRETRRKTKKAKLPALSTLSPIMPDAAAGISTFNSGVGLSEDYIGRDELIKRLKDMGYKYNYPKYTDQELYEIYRKNLKAQETKKELKKLKEIEKLKKQRYKDKLSQVKYDEDSDTYSDGNYYKDGIEFESEAAAKEYFGESMSSKVYLNDMHKAWNISEAYDYDLLGSLCVEYGSLYPYDITLDQVYDNIMDEYGDEDLANDLIEYLDSIDSEFEGDDFYNFDHGYIYESKRRSLNEDLKDRKNKIKHNFKTITEGLKYFERKEFNENYKDAELESLYEGIKNNLDQEDIKKLGNFLKKADSADDVATYIRGLLSEDIDNENFNNVTIGLYGGDETFPYPEDFYSFIDKCKRLGIIVSNDLCDEYMNWEMDLTGNGYTIYKLCRDFPGYDNTEFSANDWIYQYRIDESYDTSGTYDSNGDAYNTHYMPPEDEWDAYFSSDYYGEGDAYNAFYDSSSGGDAYLGESAKSCDGWIAIYNGNRVEIPKSDANSIYEAKQIAIKKLKVPKSKVGLLTIKPGYNESLTEDTERYSDVVPYENRKYWYFTTHGVGPGTIPKDLNVLEIREGQNDRGTWGDFICLDGVLNTSELQKYDLRELAPTTNEPLTEAYVEEWWGQGEEDPEDFAREYNLKITPLKNKYDETLYRFEGSVEAIDKAIGDGYFMGLEFGESRYGLDEDELFKLAGDLAHEIQKAGFELDDNFKYPIGKNLFKGVHLQIKNPNLIFPIEEAGGDEKLAFKLMEDDLKDIVYILDEFKEDNNVNMTFSFGHNEDMVITGGVDIR